MISPASIQQAQRKMRNRRNRAVGDHGQLVVINRMRSLGFLCVEVVHTPWRIHRNAQGRIVSASPVEKVSGDVRAVCQGGRSVLLEAKVREDRLRHSDLECHQVQALDAHAAAGGLSLIAWVSRHGVAIIDWTRVSLKPGGSLLWAEVALYDLARRA